MLKKAILVIAIICAVIVVASSDESEAYYGERFTVDGIVYSIVSDSEVNVAGADDSTRSVEIGKQVSYQGYTFDICGMKEGAFESNKNITSVLIDSSFDTISESAFKDCTSLVEVTLGKAITTIEESAFQGCTSLSELKGTVKNVFASSFSGCTSLTELPFSDTLVQIHDYAFYGCTSLEEVYISQTVKGVSLAFRNCTALASIAVSPSNSHYSTIQGILFDKETGQLLYCPAQLRITDLVTPSSVKSIGRESFSDSQWIQSITIGPSVTEVESTAFLGCKSLKEAVIESTGTRLNTSIFVNCESLQSVSFPEGTEVIPDSMFDGCSQLTTVDFPSSVRLIDNYAFRDCSSLKSFRIPDNCFIGLYILSGCTSLEDLYIGEGASGGDYCLSGVVPAHSISIPDDCFMRLPYDFFDENGNRINTGSFFADFYGHTYKGSDGEYYRDLTPEIDEDCTMVFMVDGQEYAKIVVPQFSTFDLPKAPEKEPTVQYTFQFSGWDGYNGSRVALSSQTFEASFDSKPRTYPISFSWGGAIDTVYMEYGKTIIAPSYLPGVIGWEGFEEGMTVTGPATFTAIYESESTESSESPAIYVAAVAAILVVILVAFIAFKRKP